jgi:hypothetical protein
MATLGETVRLAWLSGNPEKFGKVVDALRFKHGGTFQTQGDIFALLLNALRKGGMAERELPTLADMDAMLYQSEEHHNA